MISDDEREARKARREADQRRRIDEHVRRVVDAAPPLTDAQRNEIALLLRRR